MSDFSTAARIRGNTPWLSSRLSPHTPNDQPKAPWPRNKRTSRKGRRYFRRIAVLYRTHARVRDARFRSAAAFAGSGDYSILRSSGNFPITSTLAARLAIPAIAIAVVAEVAEASSPTRRLPSRMSPRNRDT
jgi:hypothetical protein